MSSESDIKEVCRRLHPDLPKDRCAEIYLEIVGALEWDIEGYLVDCEDPFWQEKEREAAYRGLWG